jgi:hypothetical protein
MAWSKKVSPSRQRTYYRKHRQEVKLEVLSHYGSSPPKCVKCGFSNVHALQIDHLNGGGTKHRKELGRMGSPFYIWLKYQGYPEGYQVLCANCQFIKAFEEKEFM